MRLAIVVPFLFACVPVEPMEEPLVDSPGCEVPIEIAWDSCEASRLSHLDHVETLDAALSVGIYAGQCRAMFAKSECEALCEIDAYQCAADRLRALASGVSGVPTGTCAQGREDCRAACRDDA